MDADVADTVTKDNLEQTISYVKRFAKEHQTIVAITGAIDLIANEDQCYCIYNGRSEMGRITGTGCQLSGMMTAFMVANPNNILEAAVTAGVMMGVAGEIVWEQMQQGEGNATYRNRIIDAIYNMTGDELERRAKYELR